MKSITMTGAQTAEYDAGDELVVAELRTQAQDLANQTGELVEVYTNDGIVALSAAPGQDAIWPVWPE